MDSTTGARFASLRKNLSTALSPTARGPYTSELLGRPACVRGPNGGPASRADRSPSGGARAGTYLRPDRGTPARSLRGVRTKSRRARGDSDAYELEFGGPIMAP